MLTILARRILLPHGTLEDGAIRIADGRIVAAGPSDELPAVGGGELLDARGLTVAPGLIDLHTHGGGGVQTIDGTAEALARMAMFYAQHGVTGFLAGVWGSNAHIEAGIDAVVDALRPGMPARGAALLGAYLEGPFINPERRGAFLPATIRAPDVALLERYTKRAAGHLRLLTLAPELDGAPALIRHALANGIVCAAGHSAATWEETLAAIDAGVRHVTHTFNAMTPLHHRDPGLLGAALADDRLTAEIIVDGIHVHPAAVRLLARAKRAGGAVLITDSIGAAGFPDGEYSSEGMALHVQGGAARLDDGTLAGSLLTMERGVANLVAFGAATLEEAFAIGSLNPARVLGLDSSKGRIAPAMDADLIAIDDGMRVHWTMVGGEIVFRLAPEAG